MNVYGIVFQNKGKVYYFDGLNINYEINDNVIVETEKGLQYGKITSKIDKSSAVLENHDLKHIIRKASDNDNKEYLDNLKNAEKALQKAKSIASSLDLKMNFIDASYTFDKQQLTFNFYADSRIDFRELAKKLASLYHTRIDLRHIGARDRACNVAGIGVCGKEICCARFLKSFDTVTMNMAKNQNLSLNPSKINGVCGRLLCCLKYENDNYNEYKKGLPDVGNKVKIDEGEGKVISVDVFDRTYKVLLNETNEIILVDGKNESKK